MFCKIFKLNCSSTLLLLYFYLASTLLLQNIHLTPANPISVLDQLVHHFQTKRDDLSVFPRAGTFVPRLGTFVPRPGTVPKHRQWYSRHACHYNTQIPAIWMAGYHCLMPTASTSFTNMCRRQSHGGGGGVISPGQLVYHSLKTSLWQEAQ